MTKFKVGIVGVSRGGSFMRNYARSERTEIAALCDLNQEKLASCAEKLNLPDSALYTDYDAFLNSDIDIVVVSSSRFSNCCKQDPWRLSQSNSNSLAHTRWNCKYHIVF